MFATQHPPSSPMQFPLNNTTSSPSPLRPSIHFQPHTPSHPSPLAMSQFSSPPQPTTTFPATTPPPQHTSKYAHRYATTVANPFSSRLAGVGAGNSSGGGGTSPTARAAHRRNLYLNRVKEDRDAERFEARGEQLTLMEEVAEERRRREAMGRRAERIMGALGESIEEDGDGGEMRMVDEDATAQLDEFLSHEQQMEMIDNERIQELARQQQQQQLDQRPTPDTNYSDDEYDDIFMDLQNQSQDMDMSG